MVPAVDTFPRGLKINGKTISAASGVEDFVRVINRDAPGITAVLNGNGTITLSNDTGDDIVIQNGPNNHPTATDFGFQEGVHTGFMSLKAAADKPISLQANTAELGLKGEGTVADVQKLGFNETKGAEMTTGGTVNNQKFNNSDMIKINGIKVPASVDTSAMSKAHAINKISSQTNVVASAHTEKKYALDFRNFAETHSGRGESMATLATDLDVSRTDRVSFNLGKSHYAIDKRNGVLTDLDFATASVKFGSSGVNAGSEQRLSFVFGGKNYVADKRSGLRIGLNNLSEVRAIKVGSVSMELTSSQVSSTENLVKALNGNANFNTEYRAYVVDNKNIEIRAKSGTAISPEIVKLGQENKQELTMDTTGMTLSDVKKVHVGANVVDLTDKTKLVLDTSALSGSGNKITVPGLKNPITLTSNTPASIKQQIETAYTTAGVSNIAVTESGGKLTFAYKDGVTKFSNEDDASLQSSSGTTVATSAYHVRNGSLTEIKNALMADSALASNYDVTVSGGKITFTAKSSASAFGTTNSVQFRNDGDTALTPATPNKYGYTADTNTTGHLASLRILASVDFDVTKGGMTEALRKATDVATGETAEDIVKSANYDSNTGTLDIKARVAGRFETVTAEGAVKAKPDTVAGTTTVGASNEHGYLRISYVDRDDSGRNAERILNLNVGTGDIESRVRSLNNNANFNRFFEAFVIDGDTIDIRFKNKGWDNSQKNMRVGWFNGRPNAQVDLKATTAVKATNFDDNNLVNHLKGKVDTNGDGTVDTKDGLVALSDDATKNTSSSQFDVTFRAGRLKLTSIGANQNFTNLLVDGSSVRSVLTPYVSPEQAKTGSQISVNGVRLNMVGVRDLASLVSRVNDAGITGIRAEADEKTGRLSFVSATGQNIVIRSWTGDSSKLGNPFLNGVSQASSEELSAADNIFGRIKLESKKGTAIRITGMDNSLKKAGLSAQGGQKSNVGTGLSIENNANADEALRKLDSAIDKVGSLRANLGAVQNRVMKTMNNLRSTRINMAAARSRILDTDFSKESTKLTKTNVLSQAAQAMLAQANKMPQQVLKLLQ